MYKFIKTSQKPECNPKATKIKGLTRYPNFITNQEESILLNTINKIPTDEWITVGSTQGRRVLHYGYKYNYRGRSVSQKDYLGELPKWCEFIIERLIAYKILNKRPDQLIVNEYKPGQGIGAHSDAKSFDNDIVTLSLGSDTMFEYIPVDAPNDNEIHKYYLKRKTCLHMRDDARYKYHHRMPGRKTDIVDGVAVPRKTRVSLTFRNVL